MNDIIALIAKASWREAVTYRHTWPHEYVLVNKDFQQDLLAAFNERIEQGEGIECQFFHQKKQYLFLGNYKYWTENGFSDDEIVLNRALLYRDRRDFVIQQGDSGMHEPQDTTALEQNADVVQINVRDMWANEAWDFTPWLSEKENLDLLGKEVGMSLELLQREMPIGSLSLDILARESGEGALVAIENQLELTDFDHLGRLLAYTSGSDARIAIWIAPQFVYEHAHVLHQLNEWAGSNARFYGVKVEVIRRSDGAAPEPRFRKVVYPGGWNKDITLPQDTAPPHIQLHRAFFQALVAKLRGADLGFDDGPRQRFDYSDRLFPSKVGQGVGYAASFWKDHAWVTLHIETEDNDLNKRLYDALLADRQSIESGIGVFAGSEWRWDRNDRLAYSNISICKGGSIENSPEQLEETKAWMLDLLPKLKETFDPRLPKLLSEWRQ